MSRYLLGMTLYLAIRLTNVSLLPGVPNPFRATLLRGLKQNHMESLLRFGILNTGAFPRMDMVACDAGTPRLRVDVQHHESRASRPVESAYASRDGQLGKKEYHLTAQTLINTLEIQTYDENFGSLSFCRKTLLQLSLLGM
ncbi:hypothetical protein F5Y16DRAFT_11852 [Xylariaceae sp. FL0255]|nr:hypothetical protein F5Y16DRAFT_11852 [Xylariaceae sp. FL0255]